MRNRYRIPDIPVKEIQPRFAAEFDRWLRITYQLTNNSTMKLMRQLKTMLRVGHLNGWSKSDPLAGYKIHFEKVDRGYLTDAELSRLESKVSLPDGWRSSATCSSSVATPDWPMST